MPKLRDIDYKDLSDLVRSTEQDFISGGGTQMSKYVNIDVYEDINKIYAYLASKHVSGETDSQGREKPFFNIVNSARNIYYRATDIDRKNIRVKPTKGGDVVGAFLATVLLQNWMRKTDFGTFLNAWGLELAGFNSAVVKFVEAEGELYSMVVPLSRLIFDPVNFESGLKIEILELTEAQLRQRKGYDQEAVTRLINTLTTRKTADGRQKDTKDDYIKLYEVHGVMPLSWVTGKEKDQDTFVQQMHVLSFVENKGNGDYDDFCLVSGREEKDPYMLTALIPATDGSVSLDGAVKNLFESQWMVNHTVKSIKDQMDIASKLFFQTADPNFVGRNVIKAIEQGDIMIHEAGKPLTPVNNQSHDITVQSNYMQMWRGLSAEINGVSESMQGNIAPSGTAWRQVEALLNESHSLFDLMTENKGLAIERMLRTHVIPHLKKKLNTKDEIVATLESHDIDRIDQMYIKSEKTKRAKQAVKDLLLQGQLPTDDPTADIEQSIKQDLAQAGNQRFIKPSDMSNKTWKDLIKDLEWDLEVEVTGESSDKNTILTTLNTALATIANPNYQNNPTAQLIVGKILSATGEMSPLEIASLQSQQPTVQPPVASPPAVDSLALPTTS